MAETPGPRSLDDIDLPPEKIIAAINTLKTEAAAGAEGFPAKVFKECKESLVLPLMLLWRKSLDTGKIPDIMKFGNVGPIYKGGARGAKVNYRLH